MKCNTPGPSRLKVLKPELAVVRGTSDFCARLKPQHVSIILTSFRCSIRVEPTDQALYYVMPYIAAAEAPRRASGSAREYRWNKWRDGAQVVTEPADAHLTAPVFEIGPNT